MNQDGIYMSVLDGLAQTVYFRRLGNCTVEQRKFSFQDKTFCVSDEAQWTLNMGGGNCTEIRLDSVYTFPLIRPSLMIL